MERIASVKDSAFIFPEQDRFLEDVCEARKLRYTPLMNWSNVIDEIIWRVIDTPSINSKRDLQKVVNSVLRNKGVSTPPPLFHLLEHYKEIIKEKWMAEDLRILKLFRKRAVRSLSGVSVISLLTKSWGCPWTCVFCPTFDELPKSYVPSEPAVMRAELNSFDPVKQVQNRLRSLESTGHAIAKCDVRVIGGTWSFYPKEYQETVMIGVYDGHSTYSELRKYLIEREDGDRLSGFKIRKWYEYISSKTLAEAQKRNEDATSRVIWIAIETRPDWVTPEEIRRLRVYGVTRVEIGYQTTIDEINTLNKRWHGNKESIEATRLLKDAGFKVVAHMMPNLLWSNPDIDRGSMQEIFDNPNFRPDELKIYPMVVTERSELHEVWKSGGFTPYDDNTLVDLMSDLESMLPEYVRLNRSYRDIPADRIVAGSKNSNLRELTAKRMETLWLKRRDISAREIRSKWNNPENAILEVSEYDASGWKEIFFQYIDPVDRTLFWLLRLRIPSQYYSKEPPIFETLRSSAIIREIHVFGDQLPIGAPWNGTGQHMWFGKKLLKAAEELIRKEYPDLRKIAVISGVGVRGYYRKFWYIEEETYMVKNLGE